MTGPDLIAHRRLDNRLRLLMWSGLFVLWLLPFIAARLSVEVQWTAFDHLAWGVMLTVPGAIVDLVSRLTTNWAYRGGVILALGTAFVITWANLAVGIVGDEGNPLNLVFFGVIAVAVMGAPLVRFRAASLERVFYVTAATQALSGLVALRAEPFVLVFCGVMTALWLAAAALFGQAASSRPRISPTVGRS